MSAVPPPPGILIIPDLGSFDFKEEVMRVLSFLSRVGEPSLDRTQGHHTTWLYYFIDMPETNLTRPIPVVRLIVTNAEGRVLVLRRAANTAGGNLWCLPGGKVDYGDTVEKAVCKRAS